MDATRRSRRHVPAPGVSEAKMAARSMHGKMARGQGRTGALLPRVLLPVLHCSSAAPVRQPAAWGAWQQFEDEGMLAVMDRGPALIDHSSKSSSAAEIAKSAASRWHCVAQLEQPELLLRQHEWDLNVGASVLVANTGCSSRLALLRAGYGRQVREATTRAVEIAQEARQRAQCDTPILSTDFLLCLSGSLGASACCLFVTSGA